jgi:ribosome-binding protein aMBF1 (putative translation factor)
VKIIIGVISNSRGSSRSTVVPSAELYVCQSCDAASTSR